MRQIETITLQKGTIKGFPWFLTRVLPTNYRDEFMIVAQIKQKSKRMLPFLLIVVHKKAFPFIKKFNFDVLLDEEAKRVGGLV